MVVLSGCSMPEEAAVIESWQGEKASYALVRAPGDSVRAGFKGWYGAKSEDHFRVFASEDSARVWVEKLRADYLARIPEMRQESRQARARLDSLVHRQPTQR